jgi:hypothetical protein
MTTSLQENLPPPTSWSRQVTHVVCPPLSVPSGPQLPVHHADFFQCMLTQHTVQTIAINTTAYAHSKVLGGEMAATIRRQRLQQRSLSGAAALLSYRSSDACWS